jgi:predicted nucleotidyltransferase
LIREGKKLPDNVLDKMPEIINKVSADPDVVALYAFGSLAKGDLKPLSDLDFAILLSRELDKQERLDKHLDLIGIFTGTFHTDDIDLVVLNDAPPRFAYNILKNGKRLVLKDKSHLIDFHEHTNKMFIEFKRVRDEFDTAFLQGIGYHG